MSEKIDWTKPIETTCGLPARVLATDLKYYNNETRVVVAVDQVNTTGRENVYLVDPTLNQCCGSGFFLHNKTILIEREEWVNFYLSPVAGTSLSAGHTSKKAADRAAASNRVACVKRRIQFTTGQYDD